jgi:hypothetical protein
LRHIDDSLWGEELGVDYVDRYRDLHQAGVIGTVWADSGKFFIAPVDNLFNGYHQREYITLDRLKALIDYWYPHVESACPYDQSYYPKRKPFSSETIAKYGQFIRMA